MSAASTQQIIQQYMTMFGWQFLGFVWNLLFAFFVFSGFYLGGILVRRGAERIARRRGLDEGLVESLGRAIRVTVFIIGAICALGTFGVDVTALVAGLGLTGFALGFALKDIVSNLLAGILVLTFRPFRKGDRIKVAAFEGTVQSIDLRYTILNAEGERFFVPNSMLFTNPISVVDRGSAENETSEVSEESTS